jgi:hypothetical protein
VVQLVQLSGNSQKWANNRCSAENFFGGEKNRDFFEPSHTTTYSGPKKYWEGGRHSGPLGGNSQMGKKWTKNGHSVENIFVSEESRDFFQPSHTTTYSGPKIKNGAAAQWSTGRE